MLNIYCSFISRYPNFESLSGSGNELQEFLQPLGLYRKRAKDLAAIAKIVKTEYNGELPRSRELLMKLPGVGDYVANAVLCFAFGKSAPLLDTNVIRVITRVFTVNTKAKRARTDTSLWQFMGRILPRTAYREFNLAVIDLGALVCLSRKPKCLICPIALICNENIKLSRKDRELARKSNNNR